jgi:hypothetical protein
MTICKLDDKEYYQLTIYNNGVKSQYLHCFLKCAPADTKLLFLLVIFLGGLSGIGHKLLGLLVLHVHYATQVLATPTRRQALASLVFDTLPNLAADTVYYYKAVANSNGNIVEGDLQIFKTNSLPTVITNPLYLNNIRDEDISAGSAG